jgi:hypothetical protein
MSLRAKRSNLSFFDEIATHPMGARDDRDSVFLIATLANAMPAVLFFRFLSTCTILDTLSLVLPQRLTNIKHSLPKKSCQKENAAV